MADPDDEMAALTAASDQIGAIAGSYADEFATFYRRLIERGVPAALAKTLTLQHQVYRYGWTGDE